MKKYQIYFLVILLCIASACSYPGSSVKGNGNVSMEQRLISDFESISAANGLEVILIPDSTEFVIVEADNNLFESIETELQNKTLAIYTHDRIKWAKSRKVYVHYLGLKEIKSTSGSQVRTAKPLAGKELNLSASSGSQLAISVNTIRHLEIHSSSGAQIHIDGKAENTDMKASSGAHIRGKNLLTHNCDASVSSGAHIWVEVSNSLTGKASSGGHIFYSGNPKKIESKMSSGGRVQKN